MSDWDNIINSTAELAEMRGRAEGRAELLRNLFHAGLSIDEVARLAKVDEQEVIKATHED